jgi:hypothetical protein
VIFLELWGLPLPTESPRLLILGCDVEVNIDGGVDDPAELYAIPEVRKFYQHLHRVWPYWFFFCDLETETLTMMTLCLMPNLKGFKRLGEPKAAVEYDPMDLLRFIERNFVPLNEMMERAGMGEMAIYERTKEIFQHYKLPYDVDPPGED